MGTPNHSKLKFELIFSEMSKQALAFKEKGNALFREKKYMEAIEQYTFAVECEPSNHIFYTNRAVCYATMGEWEKCLRDANRSIDKERLGQGLVPQRSSAL